VDSPVHRPCAPHTRGFCVIPDGTDFPHPNVKVMPNDGELVDLFAMMAGDEPTRKKILVDNPARLYWA
jgi:hypothetical protein